MTANLTSDYYEQSTESVIYKKDKREAVNKIIKSEKSNTQNLKEEKSNETTTGDDNTSVSPIKSNKEVVAYDYSELSDEQLSVVKLIEQGIKYADEISYKLNMEVYELFPVITELEIMGIIKSLPGKAYDII